MEQLLWIVPAFRKKLIQSLTQEEHPEVQVVEPCQLEQIEDVDFRVPTIQVEFEGKIINEVLVDGGSGVNILLEAMYKKMGSPRLEPAPFQVKMADQRIVQPLGVLKRQKMVVGWIMLLCSFCNSQNAGG